MAIQARTINLNIQPNFAITPRVNVSQYDNGVPIEFVLMDGLLEASLPSGATAKVQGTRPSGVGFSHACTISGNVLTVDSTTNMTGEAGQIPAEVVIEYSGDVIGTANFFLNVERSPHPDGTIDADIIEQAGIVERVETLETEVSDIGDLSELETEDKSSLVNAINEAASSGGGGSIATLSDVELTNLSNGQALTYDSSDSVWKNVTLGGGGSVTIDSALSGTSTNPVQNNVITTALNGKADLSDLSTVATSGNYTDLINKPTIPTKTSDLTNDSGFITSAPVTSVNGQTGAVVISQATTATDGLMSSTDKTHLDTVYADYSSALTALGVI